MNFCGTPAATSDPNQPSQATPTVSSCLLSQRSWSDPRPLTSETMDNAAAASETSRSVSASPAMIAAPLSKAFVAVEPRDASVARTR